MDLLETLVLIVHVVVTLTLIGLVLIQHGKGADAGAAFGGGASQTVFGSQGSGSFLTRMTTGLALVFFVTSFSLAIFAKKHAQVASMISVQQTEQSAAPAAQKTAQGQSTTSSADSAKTSAEKQSSGDTSKAADKAATPASSSQSQSASDKQDAGKPAEGSGLPKLH